MSQQRPVYDAHTMATAGEVAVEDGVKWLALLIRQGFLLIAAGIARRYGLDK